MFTFNCKSCINLKVKRMKLFEVPNCIYYVIILFSYSILCADIVNFFFLEYSFHSFEQFNLVLSCKIYFLVDFYRTSILSQFLPVFYHCTKCLCHKSQTANSIKCRFTVMDA